MAQVTVRINGYAYTVGCEDGQEAHLQAMAAQVESRIASIRALGNQSGESRLLVLAGLLMADELHDQAAELERLASAPPAAAPAAQDSGSEGARLALEAAAREQATGERLRRLAERAEAIAVSLEAP